MATVNKDFRVKNGIVVEGATGTIDGSNILTEASTEFLQDTVGGMVTGNTESNITVTYDDDNGKLNFSSTDTNTTYSVSAETATGGANLRLTDSAATTDDVKIASGTAITVSRTDANTITVTNDGVTALTGTANEVEVSASSGSVTVGLPDNVTIGGTLTVTGDLTVNGTTTTLNTDTLAVEDNIVVLNSNVTGTPSLDAGIEVERGTYTNAKIYWNETENAWYLSTPGDSGDAATEAAITASGSLSLFNTISDGSNTATPDSSNDTLTFAAGTGLTASVNGTTDTVTFSLDAAATASVLSVTLPDALLGSATATSAGTSVTLDTFSTTTYSSAKYVVQAKNGSGDIEVTELLVTVDGSGNVYLTEYANIFSNASLAEFTATQTSNTLTFTADSTTSGVVFKVSKTYIEA
jgi:hypothetical protein